MAMNKLITSDLSVLPSPLPLSSSGSAQPWVRDKQATQTCSHANTHRKLHATFFFSSSITQAKQEQEHHV